MKSLSITISSAILLATFSTTSSFASDLHEINASGADKSTIKWKLLTEEEIKKKEIVQEPKTFDDLFVKTLEYSTTAWVDQDSMSPTRFLEFSAHSIRGTTEEKFQIIAEKLIGLSSSMEQFEEVASSLNSPYTYLELLYGLDLSKVAEIVCSEIKNDGRTLKANHEILLQISQGENVEFALEDFPQNKRFLPYLVANNVGNSEMVANLYESSGAKADAESYINGFINREPNLYSTYIHEPYWSYNFNQLEEYAQRIVGKISPHFIQDAAILETESGRFIKADGEAVRVRTVPFGYVLPNLYLKERLEKQNSKTRGVARLFILPKDNTAKFNFRMPYASTQDHMNMKYLNHGDLGDNPMQVLSNSFTIYQEYIDGTGYRGDKSFADLGHMDFNATQIITSEKDGKKYLIDTKEQKNFFAPYFVRGTDEKWKTKGRKHIYKAKTLHFEARKIFVDVEVDL